MSEDRTIQQQGDGPAQPDFSKFYHPRSVEPERGLVAKPLITLDKDLETKTRIPDAFVMATWDILGEWSEWAEGELRICPNQSCKLAFDSEYEYVMHRFGERYRVNKISEIGQSRQEYVDVTSAPFSLGMKEINEEGKRIQKEGVRK